MSDTSISNTTQPHPDYHKFAALFELRPGGVLVFATNRGTGKAGTSPKAKSKGYLTVRAGKRMFLAHRVVYLLTYGRWPEAMLDHIDGNKLNNDPCNLRDADARVNAQNLSCKPRSNTSGFLGVSLHKPSRLWTARARDQVTGAQISLGYFRDPAVAHEAYMKHRRVNYAGHVEMHAPVYGGAL